MSRNERTTCANLIEPALEGVGWDWEREVRIGPGRVNIAGDSMYASSQQITADYVLRWGHLPLAVLEAKAEGTDLIDGVRQGLRYSRRLGLRFSIASNGW